MCIKFVTVELAQGFFSYTDTGSPLMLSFHCLSGMRGTDSFMSFSNKTHIGYNSIEK